MSAAALDPGQGHTFVWTQGGNKVEVRGSWDAWGDPTPLKPGAGEWLGCSVRLPLPPGVYMYKFVVDGVWMHDAHKPTVSDGAGGLNNAVRVLTAGTFVHPATGTALRHLTALPTGHGTHRTWPLLLYLHGPGERSADDLSHATVHGPAALLEANVQPGGPPPGSATQILADNFVVVVPQVASTWSAVSREVMALIKALIPLYHIDPSRIYITGARERGAYALMCA